MDLLESVKRFLEKEDGENESTIDSLPAKFIEPIVVQGLKVDLAEPGRLICSLKVPPRLVVQFYTSISLSLLISLFPISLSSN